MTVVVSQSHVSSFLVTFKMQSQGFVLTAVFLTLTTAGASLNNGGAKGSGTVLGELESAIETMVEYYNKYSAKENLLRKGGIRKSNFRRMLQSELNHMLTDTKNKEAVRKLFQDLDQNGDGVIDFDEYWALIGAIVKPIARDKQ